MPAKMKQHALLVVKNLREAGFTALWAGGCVRDMLLGNEPHDYDVASDASPDQVRKLFRRTIAVGAQFGVIEVLGPEPGLHVQVATFRSDGQYTDGRHPDSVRFGTPQEDALRRDFTINGLFFDPVTEEVIDYVGGQKDLTSKILRAIGNPDTRIEEDKLRMLRAIRFVSRLGFTLEEQTAEAIRSRPADIKQVSTERITEELKKMLVHPTRVMAVELLWNLKLLETLLPRFKPATLQLPMLENLPERVSFPLAWAALLLDLQITTQPEEPLSAGDVQVAFGSQFRLSQAEIQQTWYLIHSLGTIRNAHQIPWAVLKPILANPHQVDLLTLLSAGVKGHGWSAAGLTYIEEKLSIWSQAELEPRVLVTGEDVSALGLPPGPLYKALLESVRTAQLNEEITSREEALLRLKQQAATIESSR